MQGPELFISTAATDREAVGMLNRLFYDAALQGASDILFQEDDGECRVRFRVPGGRLEDRLTLPRGMTRHVDDKIRARAKLAQSDRHNVLSGRMRLRWPDRRIDIRVEITPTVVGQHTVCRLLDQSNAARRLDDIEMTSAVRDAIQQLIDEPSGLFLVTGPTGSGKTTTLYAILNELNRPDCNIITVEDPVEYQVAGLSQINVDAHVTFPKALRSVLRQVPNIILIGEIRDAETAQIAVQASITGHLVLASLHANNAAMAVTRMIDLGVDALTLSASLRGVTAQRLVRRISGTPVYESPNEADLHWLRQHGMQFLHPPRFAIPEPEQVPPYSGNVPVIEFIVVDGAVRKAAADNAGVEVIYAAAARQPQFETIAQAGARLAMTGETSLAEIRRITSGVDIITAGERRLGSVLISLGIIDTLRLQDAVAHVIQVRQEGRVIRLGQAIIEINACSFHDLVAGMGHAPAAAMTVANSLVTGGLIDRESMEDLQQDWLRDWQATGVSLFDAMVGSNLCSLEDIHAAADISYGR